ncbi:AbrB/MazE/SpoVT family DNA-binding domain-containing protein [Candidatus Gottesmanbacteria bacterium]|nr:AbrB/MazE/SpoVT family DNA-binding domain-containing protein [Candidatus Gottesmanbacteria bacterium]
MAPQLIANINQDEWLKVLGKGMVTIPKKWRDDLGFTEGDVIKATKQGKAIMLTSPKTRAVPYRIYTDDEIKTFLKDDRIL